MQNLTVGDLAGIKSNLHRFSMPRGAGAHSFIFRSILVTAAISRYSIEHPTHVLKHALHAPKATAGENCHFGLGTIYWLVLCRSGNGNPLLMRVSCRHMREGETTHK